MNTQPLAYRMRPRVLEEVAGQNILSGKEKLFIGW